MVLLFPLFVRHTPDNKPFGLYIPGVLLLSYVYYTIFLTLAQRLMHVLIKYAVVPLRI